MIVGLLSNIAIMLINLYLVWRISGGIYKSRFYNYRQIIQFIILQTFIGFFLISNPIVLYDMRFDFRAILYAFTTKFLGVKVAIPLIILLSILRILILANEAAFLNMIVGIVYALILRWAYEWIRKRQGVLGQLLFLVNLYMIMAAPIFILSIGSPFSLSLVFLIVTLLANLFSTFLYAIFQDIRTLSSLSNRDGLTHLYNSNKFRSDIELMSKHHKQYTMIVIDIDHFKTINDTYGHLVGDKVIKKVSNLLKRIGGKDYLFYRFGGEEFVTIMNDKQGDQAKKLAYSIQEALKEVSFNVEGHATFSVTVSMGIAKREGHEPLIQTFERADRALYTAKDNGRNRVEVSQKNLAVQET